MDAEDALKIVERMQEKLVNITMVDRDHQKDETDFEQI